MKGNNDSLIVRTDGEVSGVPVSMQIYQAIYNDITGKTEKITDTYNKYYTVTLNDLINLEKQINQFCEQYHVESASNSITIFHTKNSKERFSSFERLNTYNVACTSPIERIYVEVNLLIVLPKAKTPQPYKINITLTSGVALVDKHEANRPAGLPQAILMRATQKETAEFEVEYIDYIVARSLSDLFRGWIDALPEVQPNKKIEWWQKKSHIVRQFIANLFMIIAAYFSANYTIKYFSETSETTANLASFLIVVFTALVLIRTIGNMIGHRVERVIDEASTNLFSRISFNAGDKILAEKYVKKSKNSKMKIIKELIITFLIAMTSSIIAAYLIK